MEQRSLLIPKGSSVLFALAALLWTCQHSKEGYINKQNFILSNVSKQSCFNTEEFYFKDSIMNIRDITLPKHVYFDSVSRLLLERHSWTSGSCDNNRFVVITNSENRYYFIPFCDERILINNRKSKDELLVKENLYLNEAINKFMSGRSMQNKKRLIVSIFDSTLHMRRVESIAIGKGELLKDIRFENSKDSLFVTNRVLSNIRKKNVFYYYPLDGLHGIWEVIVNDERIETAILNAKGMKCISI